MTGLNAPGWQAGMKSGPRPADLGVMGQSTDAAGGLMRAGADGTSLERDTKSARARTRPGDEPLQLERRGVDRSRARGHGVGTFVDPDGRLWLTRVTLVDRSDSGMGVRCPVPVSAGATFSLSIEGSVTPVQGAVAHAKGRGGGYRLGLHCGRRMAA